LELKIYGISPAELGNAVGSHGASEVVAGAGGEVALIVTHQFPLQNRLDKGFAAGAEGKAEGSKRGHPQHDGGNYDQEGDSFFGDAIHLIVRTATDSDSPKVHNCAFVNNKIIEGAAAETTKARCFRRRTAKGGMRCADGGTPRRKLHAWKNELRNTPVSAFSWQHK